MALPCLKTAQEITIVNSERRRGNKAIQKKTKIVHVIVGLGVGGAERLLESLIARSDGSVFEHEVITLTSTGEMGNRLVDLGVRVIEFGLPSLSRAASNFLEVRSSLKSADVVHSWMYHANVIGGALTPRGKPLLWSFHATELEKKYTKIQTRLFVYFCKILSQWMPTVSVYCSPSSREYHSILRYDTRNSCIINNGVDIERFKPAPKDRHSTRVALGLDGKFVIGSVSRWHAQKDHMTLLRAFSEVRKKVDNLHLVLCGAGLSSTNGQLVAAIEELGLRQHVSLLGPQANVQKILVGLDVFAFSSAFGEALPLALCEAMACGVPAIVTDVGECSAVVGNAGWIVHPRDVSAFARAIFDAWSADVLVRQRIAEAARSRIVNNYDVRAVATQYEDLYSKLCA